MQVQAALYLKNLVNNSWNVGQSTPFADKENVIPNSNQFAQMLSAQDREFLRVNIVSALDLVVHLSEDPQSKVIVSSIENIIYNIAQCDYEMWAKSSLHANISQRLQAGDERCLVSGLRTLKAVLQAFEFEIHEERKPLNQLVEFFFPILEGVLSGPTFN